MAVLIICAADTNHAVAKEGIDTEQSIKWHREKYFDLSEVQLLDGPLKRVKQQVHQYLLQWDLDRLLYWHRKAAGLQPRADHYAGWDKEGSNMLGHYLSAVSYMYATTRDRQLLDRVNYIVRQLGLCQEAGKDGSIFNGMGYKEAFDKMRKGQIEFKWIGPEFPLVNGGNYFYGIHKNLAGLRDAYLLAKNEKAKTLLVRYVDWVDAFVQSVPEKTFQLILQTEHGGMAEVITDVYAITGNPKYASLARQFVQHNLCAALAADQDVLFPHHANATLAQFVGYARLFELMGNQVKNEGAASLNFWNRVIKGHTLANGGNSEYERFGPSGKISQRIGFSSSETCNTYNMLKLSATLYATTGNKKYYDYYEKAMYNSILASVSDRGMFCYYLSLKPGWFKTFSTPFNSNWCCVGTGIESPAKYEEHIYAHDSGTLLINLFIPSAIEWKERKLSLRQEGDLCEGDTIRLSIVKAKQKTMLKVRNPSWATHGYEVFVNGKKRPAALQDGYIILGDAFSAGDIIKLVMPQELRVDKTDDNPFIASFSYGPFLLAGKLGTEGLPPGPLNAPEPWDFYNIPEIKNIPVIVASDQSINEWITKQTGAPLTFHLHLKENRSVTLQPLYTINSERYSVYWDYFTTSAWENFNHQKEQFIKDEVIAGDSASEMVHSLAQSESRIQKLHFKHYRSASPGGWFSYKLQTRGNTGSLYLVLKCWGGGWGQDPRGVLDVFVNGARVGIKDLGETGHETTFYNACYEVPASLLDGKKELLVKLQARIDSIQGGIYKLRLVSPEGLPLKELLNEL